VRSCIIGWKATLFSSLRYVNSQTIQIRYLSPSHLLLHFLLSSYYTLSANDAIVQGWVAASLSWSLAVELGRGDDKAIGMAVNFGAMMMHHHHHGLHILTVETMLWSK